MVRFLSSTKLAVALCLVLSAEGIAGSLLYRGNTEIAVRGAFNIYRSPLFLVPAGLLVLNILFCLGKRIPSLPPKSARTWAFAGMHLGIVLIAAGMVLDGAYGFLGTKNFYVGLPESTYFDWKEYRERSFPFAIEIVGTEVRYHPLNLQVGVMNPAGGKTGIFTVREGVPFEIRERNIRVTPRRFDIEAKTLLLDAEVDGRTQSGLVSTPARFAKVEGYAVYTVSFHDPEPSEFVVRVRFRPGGGAWTEKVIGANRPAAFGGTSFSLVNLGADRYGNPYAGLQMTREPGEPVAWAGAILFGLSLLVRFLRRAPAGRDGGPENGRDGGEDGGEDGGPKAAAGLSAALLLFLSASGAEAFGTVIGGEKTWEGEVRVVEPVTVDNGATLRLRPGTTVLLSGEDRDGDGCRDGYIQVFGTLFVEGEKGRPVRFLRLDPSRAWEEVFLKDAKAVIRGALFEGGRWGLHIHEGDVRIENTVFRGNGGGARLRGTGAAFSHCTIEGNDVGLRFWSGGPSVRGSAIVRNGTGLFYREGKGGGRIGGTLIANREWNLKVGDWAIGDLDASGNYWGNGEGRPDPLVGDFRERKEGRIVLSPSLPSPPEPCGADLGGER